MQNLGKGLFSGAGLFVVKASGTGTLFFNSFGAIYPLELQVGEEMVVDTGHLVAWDADMNYKVTKASSGIMSSLTSGEMLVCKFTGPGKFIHKAVILVVLAAGWWYYSITGLIKLQSKHRPFWSVLFTMKNRKRLDDNFQKTYNRYRIYY